jgi:hypothetical protein
VHSREVQRQQRTRRLAGAIVLADGEVRAVAQARSRSIACASAT